MKEKQHPVIAVRVFRRVLWYSHGYRLVTYSIMGEEYAHARRN